MSQICAIAGFGTGVSMSVAKAFGKEGYTLALIACSRAKLEENAQELKANYNVHLFAADAADEVSLIQAFTNIRAELGDPEVLIYNAFAATPGTPSSLDAKVLIADFHVNVVGALIAVQQVQSSNASKPKGNNSLDWRRISFKSGCRCLIVGYWQRWYPHSV